MNLKKKFDHLISNWTNIFCKINSTILLTIIHANTEILKSSLLTIDEPTQITLNFSKYLVKFIIEPFEFRASVTMVKYENKYKINTKKLNKS